MSGREAARSSEWAQHFSNASCFKKSVDVALDNLRENTRTAETQLTMPLEFEISKHIAGCIRDLRTKPPKFLASYRLNFNAERHIR